MCLFLCRWFRIAFDGGRRKRSASHSAASKRKMGGLSRSQKSFMISYRMSAPAPLCGSHLAQDAGRVLFLLAPIMPSLSLIFLLNGYAYQKNMHYFSESFKKGIDKFLPPCDNIAIRNITLRNESDNIILSLRRRERCRHSY